MEDGFNVNHAMLQTQGGQTVDRTIAEFYTEPVHLEARSRDEGRPIYEDREFVKIIIPGNRGSVVVQPVGDEHKLKYPRQYEAFQKDLAMVLEGTPLGDWPPISRALAKEYGHFHIYTVEHLAGVNDVQIQHMPMGTRELVKAARVFLDAAQNGTGPLMQLVEKNSRLEAEVARARDENAGLAARVELLEAARKSAGAGE